MKHIPLFLSILALTCSTHVNAQTTIKATPESWTAYNCEATFKGETIHLTNKGNGSALLWLTNTTFKNGIIELDMKGKDVNGQSFVGIAFHGVDNSHYEAVYFRPFNFRSGEKRGHSVQYVHIPEYDWDVLREKHPGKYENAVNPAPDPNDWFHVKIIIAYPQVRVFVNGSDEPSLAVEQISKRGDGKLGLWVDSQEGWFRNVKVTQHK